MGSVQDAIDGIESWWNTDDNQTFPLQNLMFIDHGEQGAIGMGSGLNWQPGTSLSYDYGDEGAGSDFANFTAELMKLHTNNGLNHVTFYGCSTAGGNLLNSTDYCGWMHRMAVASGVTISVYTGTVFDAKQNDGTYIWYVNKGVQRADFSPAFQYSMTLVDP